MGANQIKELQTVIKNFATNKSKEPLIDESLMVVPSMPILLETALRINWDFTDSICEWIKGEDDPKQKILLLNFVGDLSKHFVKIQNRLLSLGGKLDDFDFSVNTSFKNIIVSVDSYIEKLCLGVYCFSYLKKYSNDFFVRYCKATGDELSLILFSQIDEDLNYYIKKVQTEIADYRFSLNELNRIKEIEASYLETLSSFHKIIHIKTNYSKQNLSYT